eukprot:ctg_1121.g578
MVASHPAGTVAGQSLKASAPDERVRDGMRLHEFLALMSDPKLAVAVDSMFMACKVVGYEVRTASCSKEECVNAFGDQQLAIDLLADKTIGDAMKASGVIAVGSSEEQPVENQYGGDAFSVAWDPLDGSSIVDTNFSVGTIYGIWPGQRLTGITGRQMAAAGMAVYGPRTSMTVAVDGIPGTHEFLLIDNFSGQHVRAGQLARHPGQPRIQRAVRLLVTKQVPAALYRRDGAGLQPDPHQGQGRVC